MELLKAYLKERRLMLAAFLLFVGVFAVSFALYGLPLAAVGYPAGLCVLLGACLAAWDYGRAARRHKALKRLREAGEAVLLDLPAMTTVEGADCAAVVETLRRELCRQETARAARWEDMTAYYTAWVHQIKTPIAAMRLTLQGEDTPAARRLMTELGRVEQYVDMALTYLRLEEGGSDYVIRTCAVDDVVCAAVRRFAGEFIDRRIALDYTPVEWETVTDGKWLTFVVEQLLSNALKYTGQDGTIRIYREGDDLCIRDSGIGIAPEDLPRVFQMGYTGQNGRLDRRSSGIGLYLCQRICRNLRHEIRIGSVPGVGTTVRLTLGRGVCGGVRGVGGQSRPPLQWFTGRFCKRAIEDAGPYDILLSPLQRVGNVTMVFGKGKGKRWKGGGGRGILTVLGDGAMGRRLPKEKEVML